MLVIIIFSLLVFHRSIKNFMVSDSIILKGSLSITIQIVTSCGLLLMVKIAFEGFKTFFFNRNVVFSFKWFFPLDSRRRSYWNRAR